MYPISIGYDQAVGRIQKLQEYGHHAEALVTAMFTVEKTLRRTLRQIVVSAGFTSKAADKVVGNLRGFDALKSAWPLYDPRERRLVELIGTQQWSVLKHAGQMRNELVHGRRAYALKTCKELADDVLTALNTIKIRFDETYNYSGWTKHRSRKKSRLHAEPIVRT